MKLTSVERVSDGRMKEQKKNNLNCTHMRIYILEIRFRCIVTFDGILIYYWFILNYHKPYF